MPEDVVPRTVTELLGAKNEIPEDVVARAAELRHSLKACVTNELGAELEDEEIKWMTDEVLGIYVAARRTEPERLQVLGNTLLWRIRHREVLNSTLECPHCQENPSAHDARHFGVDADGDPIFMNCFALPQNLGSETITHHMICLFERALRECPVPRGEPLQADGHPRPRVWTWVIDLYGFGVAHMNPMTSIALLELLQVAYRGRLKRLILVDAPFGFWSFWYMISSFIKPATAKLIEFCKWSDAPKRYRVLFGQEIAATLIREGMENRDDANVGNKKWATFYGPGVQPSIPMRAAKTDATIDSSVDFAEDRNIGA